MGHTYSVFRVFTVSTILGTEVSRVDILEEIIVELTFLTPLLKFLYPR
jgi:hypothetical protein